MLVSGYQDEIDSPFEKLSMAEKFDESRKSIERLHPGHGKELEKPMIVEWARMPYNEGSWLRRFTPQQKAPGISLTPQTGQGTNPAFSRTETDPGLSADDYARWANHLCRRSLQPCCGLGRRVRR